MFAVSHSQHPTNAAWWTLPWTTDRCLDCCSSVCILCALRSTKSSSNWQETQGVRSSMRWKNFHPFPAFTSYLSGELIYLVIHFPVYFSCLALTSIRTNSANQWCFNRMAHKHKLSYFEVWVRVYLWIIDLLYKRDLLFDTIRIKMHWRRFVSGFF